MAGRVDKEVASEVGHGGPNDFNFPTAREQDTRSPSSVPEAASSEILEMYPGNSGARVRRKPVADAPTLSSSQTRVTNSPDGAVELEARHYGVKEATVATVSSVQGESVAPAAPVNQGVEEELRQLAADEARIRDRRAHLLSLQNSC